MGFFSSSDDQQNYANTADQYQNADPNQASISHELIGGAAAFEAAKAWENHQAANGAPPSHALAKEIIAGATGAFIDREVETRGLDFIDKEKAKREARQQAEAQIAPNYDDQGNYVGN